MYNCGPPVHTNTMPTSAPQPKSPPSTMAPAQSSDTLKESILWSIRLARWGPDFPKSYTELEWDGIEAHQAETVFFAADFWEFLEPFFASRGYNLYFRDPTWGGMVPRPSPKPLLETKYPFSRVIQSDKPATQFWGVRIHVLVLSSTIR